MFGSPSKKEQLEQTIAAKNAQIDKLTTNITKLTASVTQLQDENKKLLEKN